MTRFSDVPQRAAITVLFVTLAAAAWLAQFAATTPTEAVNNVGPDHGDAFLYLHIQDLMRGGTGYYDAAHKLLLEQGYGTASVFNWRTPALPGFLSLFPSIVVAQGALLIVASTTVLLIYRMYRAERSLVFSLAAISCVISSLLLFTAPAGAVSPEIVSGLLILLSVANYGNGWPIAGLITALLALFVRELAAPYVLVCVAFAIFNRNRRELIGWSAGLIAYAAYFALHFIAVTSRLGPVDRAYPDSWVRFGGVRFIIETSHYNGALILTPFWFTAALLPIAIIGLFAWRRGMRAALTVMAYLCIFSVVGKANNDYWGAIYGPLLLLGIPWGMLAVYNILLQPIPLISADLWRRGRRHVRPG